MMDDILAESSGVQKVLARAVMPLIADKPEKVGAALARVVAAPELTDTTGTYFSKHENVIVPSRRARDEQLARELWDVSAQLTKGETVYEVIDR